MKRHDKLTDEEKRRLTDFTSGLRKQAEAEPMIRQMSDKQLGQLIQAHILPDFDLTTLAYLVLEISAERLKNRNT